MATKVYSHRLAVRQVPLDFSGGSFFVVPPGFVYVVRDLRVETTALNPGDQLQIYAQTPSLLHTTVYTSPGAPRGHLLEGDELRLILEAGDQMRFSTTSSGLGNTAFVWLSGYTLTLP